MDLFESKDGQKNNSCAKPKKARTEKQVANDIIFQALADEFYPSGVGPDDAKLIGKITRNLRAKNNCTPEEIRRRIANFPRKFPHADGGCTINGLNRQWDKLGDASPHIPGNSKSQKRYEQEQYEHALKLAEECRQKEAAVAWCCEWWHKDPSIPAIREEILSGSNKFLRDYYERHKHSLALRIYQIWTQRNQ